MTKAYLPIAHRTIDQDAIREIAGRSHAAVTQADMQGGMARPIVCARLRLSLADLPLTSAA